MCDGKRLRLRPGHALELTSLLSSCRCPYRLSYSPYDVFLTGVIAGTGMIAGMGVPDDLLAPQPVLDGTA